VEACFSGALQISGRELLAEELTKIILCDKVYYDLSDGGVTFTGGEPTMYVEFIMQLCRLIRNEGIHIAIDTCGYVSREDFQKLAPLCDLFLYDIKMIDNERHKTYTGVPNQVILDNLAWLVRTGSKVRIRVPLIPSVNDDESNITDTARFLLTLGIFELDLLPI